MRKTARTTRATLDSSGPYQSFGRKRSSKRVADRAINGSTPVGHYDADGFTGGIEENASSTVAQLRQHVLDLFIE